ncbi:hypothetical protein [Bradyrhizobium sp.]|uniref:hypothetical protein n=1 Tax=Bradyrhizobium sp. TaxID=376 RepID=UPI003C6B5E37
MSDKELIPLGAAIAGDIMSAFQLPGGNTVSKIAEKWLERKRAEAAEILINEVSIGGPIDFSEHDVDPLIEISYRFAKAVNDGAARENLRLLAQVIVGLKKNKALEPDKFRKWANTLEQLTRDELMVIGKAVSIKRRMSATGAAFNTNEFANCLRSELTSSGYAQTEIDPLCASLVRTGLLLTASGYGGVIVPLPTSWLDELGALADVEGLVGTRG